MFKQFTWSHLARIAFILILLISMFGVVPVRAAATITVNSLADSTLNDGVCTLREAIIAANTETASGAAVGECVRGTGGDTIVIAASLSGGTILLGSALPHIGGDLTINGSALTSKITIDGANSYKIFYIDPGLIVSMISLIIVHGYDDSGVTPGGGIYNAGTLTVTDSVFSDNFSQYGGGITNEGILTIANSTFSGNSASFRGGGIMNFTGTLTVTNSTFSGNNAGDTGGGISNDDNLILANITFSGNSANSNGGGIYNSDELAMINTIVANSSSGGDCYNDGGSIGTNIHNLVEDGSCSASLSGDPNLGPLQNNGGSTQTIALGGGSPAFDAGDDVNCPLTDQRGVPRPQEGHCDIGAYESTLIHVNSTADTVSNNGTCTLREAILAANSDAQLGKAIGECAAGKGTDLIDFSSSLSGATIYLVSGLPSIAANAIIDGSLLASKITIDGAGHGSVFSVNSEVNVYLGSLTIAHGNASNGGGIHNSGTLTVEKNLFDGNTAGSGGGGIYNDGSLTITNSAFSNNTASIGGAIINNNGTLIVINNTFNNNSANNDGGGISNSNGTITITNSTFNGNSANNGGGLGNLGTLTLINSTFSNNSAVGSGGGIRNDGTLNYTNTILANSTNGGDCSNNSMINTNINNLVEDSSCSASLSGDPLLGPLANNGGFTETMALLAGSPAINAGTNTVCPSTDQRGLNHSDGQCDIGAYEYVYIPSHDDFDTPVIISNKPYQDLVNVTSATQHADDPTVGVSCDGEMLAKGRASVWYQYTPASTGSISLDTLGSTYDTYLAVWTGTRNNLTLVACDNNTSTTSASQLSFNATAGIPYFIEVAEYSGGQPASDRSLKFHVTSFADVAGDHVFWRYIEGFYSQGITTGCSATTYCPDNLVTRAAMAVFILRAKHGSSHVPSPAQTNIFSDLPVAGKEWMQPWIEEFYEEGITAGCGTNPLQYCPENTVTRAAMAVFLLRAKYGADYVPPEASNPPLFADVPVAGKEWMQPWVEEFYRQGYTTGCGTAPVRYCPEDPVKRAAMAVFIDRVFNIPQVP